MPYVGIDETTGRAFGIFPDILNEMSSVLNFTYEMVPSFDGNYGSVDSNGSWNGLIKMILDKRVDFSMSLLSVTYIRYKTQDLGMFCVTLLPKGKLQLTSQLL